MTEPTIPYTVPNMWRAIDMVNQMVIDNKDIAAEEGLVIVISILGIIADRLDRITTALEKA